MTSHRIARHWPALRRAVLFALLVALPAIIVSSQLAAMFGPLHTHDPSEAAGPASDTAPGLAAWAGAIHAHAHAGGAFARHWHLPGDRSVILVGGESAERTAALESRPRAKASLPLAPPVQPPGTPARAAHVAARWPVGCPERWTSQVPQPPERPPCA